MASSATPSTASEQLAHEPALANVLYTEKDGIAYVTVNRPKVLNALNMPTWVDLRKAVEHARDHAAVRGVILTGTIADPQLVANDIVVPLEGAGGNLKATISSPFKLHGIPKVSARRAPELGEHTDKVLEELGFNAQEVDGLRAGGAIPKAATRTTAKA